MEAETADLAIEVRDLSVNFGGVQALSDVALEARVGEVTAVIGPNGAGKTTLFNCISGFTRRGGRLSLCGSRIDHLNVTQRCALGLGRTFQTPALIASLSVLDNLKLGCHSWTKTGASAAMLALPRAKAEERETTEWCMEILRALELEDQAAGPVDGLPHRERRLVEIGRALAGRPRVLLLDEPAAGSSQGEAMHMMESTIAYSQAHQISVLLVEHNVRLVMQVADQVHVLDFGRKIASGTPSAVQNNEAVIRAYLGGAA